MTDTSKPQIGSRVLINLACVVVVIAGLRAAESVIVPLLLSVFLTMLGVPLLNGLMKVGLPKSFSVLAVVLAMLVVLVGVGALVGGSVNRFTKAVPAYQQRMTQLQQTAEERLKSLSEYFFDSTVAEDQVNPAQQILDQVNPARVLQFAGNLLSRLAGIVSDVFLVILTTIFMLSEAAGFGAKLRAAFGATWPQHLALGNVMNQVHHYLIIKSGISFVTGLVIGIWVWAWGVDFPILWGLLAFLFNYIPNIGSIMAAVPPILLALIQPDGGVALAITVAIGYLVVNFVLGNILEPRFLGQRLGLSTLVVFGSLVFWGWVWGAVGMLLSVPLTMVVKILLQNNEEFGWVAVLLEKAPEKAPASE